MKVHVQWNTNGKSDRDLMSLNCLVTAGSKICLSFYEYTLPDESIFCVLYADLRWTP